jgi:hypothetical protein
MRIITTVHEALERAAHIIEQRGWIQNDAESAKGICLTHALLLAADASTLRVGLLRPPVCTILGLPFSSPVSLMVWNDQKGRTQQEVIDALRAAASLAKEIMNTAHTCPCTSGDVKDRHAVHN